MDKSDEIRQEIENKLEVYEKASLTKLQDELSPQEQLAVLKQIKADMASEGKPKPVLQQGSDGKMYLTL